MQNTCPNPGCGAMYNLTSAHVGRSFACKKCGAALVVTPAGLELAGGVDELAGADEPPPVRRSPRFDGGAAFTQFWERVRADLSTWLFGAGAFFVILCLFFPLLDREKVNRRQMKVDQGDRKQRRLDRELELRAQDAKPEEQEALLKEREARRKARKHWEEVEKPKLEEEVNSTRDSGRAWGYWYIWGTMWGFLFLSFAALGYLTPQQPLIRRIVGSIIICAMLLLIFFTFVGQSRFR